MGALTSRQNAGVEEVDVVTNHAYKYPPKSGNYFGSHFIMGGERFDTPQPEAYLFGENADLNFLGSRPTPFPYPPPQPNEPTKTLKSLVNIRKESLRLVKACHNGRKIEGEVCSNPLFNIEFIFDCDVKTSITIYYLASEEINPTGVVYVPKDPSMNSETYSYNRGAHQLFSQPAHIFDPSKFSDEELLYNPDKEVIPIAIHCVAQEGSEDAKQSHTSIAVVDRHSDGTYVLKALKQKLFVDGLCYLLQEIYGIENKNLENIKPGSDVETEDNGSECVICMCDVRDTLILPCRHLCLCNSCADSLRYQANNCPICRAPFRALLQIRALQKSSNQLSSIPPEGSCENIPAGYEGVSLIEALNGPCVRPPPPHPSEAESPDQETMSHLATSRHSLEKIPKSSKMVGSPDYEGVCGFSAQEVRMSVLSSRDCDSLKEKGKSPLLSSRRRERSKHKDSVRTVNETSLNQEEPQEEEMDSEAEKLSPLLSNREEATGGESESAGSPLNSPTSKSPELPLSKTNSPPHSSSPTQSCRVVEGTPSTSILPTGGDDSDYYTPEDPPTTILSPLHAEKGQAEYTALML